MAIYRGPGGAGDATNDATSESIISVEAAAAAQASATAAASSASSASTSASNAATSATNAANSASAALASENAAETAETNAETAQAAAEAAQAAAEAARDASLDFGDTLSVQVSTLAAGSDATVVYDSNDYIIEFGIPRGDTGATGATGAAGPANTLSIGTVTSGTTAAASITGTAPNQTLNLTLPKGDVGDAATITVGSVSTGAAGSNVIITNSGTSGAAVLNFTIPRGDTGATGPQGPQGIQGLTGATGAAATVAVGTVTTGAAGSSAIVTNSGTSSAAVFNFTIPKGDTGATGATGVTGVGIDSVTLTSGTHAPGTLDTYTITYTDASTDTFQVYNGSNGTGTGTVTSVAMSVPTGLSISGSPITTSGTLALTLTSGYSIPTTAAQTSWTNKQDALVSGTNIKSVNSTSLLGSGDLALFAGGLIQVKVVATLPGSPDANTLYIVTA